MCMRVAVYYLAQMKRAAGCSSEVAELPGAATLRSLLGILADRHGASLRELLLDEAQAPRRWLLFFVGDVHVDSSYPLRDGDAVTILAPMAGG
jgi:molybdopterin converting factor small subunit